MPVDLKTLEKLLALAKKNKLAELEVEDGRSKFRIKLRQPAASSSVVHAAAASQIAQQVAAANSPLAAVSAPAVSRPSAVVAEDDRKHKVLSPFVGTFYRSPSPESEPYVKEGQTIKKGEVLCIVEAMKLMNEIESEVSGKVVAVLAENGQPVEYGEPLFMIEPV